MRLSRNKSLKSTVIYNLPFSYMCVSVCSPRTFDFWVMPLSVVVSMIDCNGSDQDYLQYAVIKNY